MTLTWGLLVFAVLIGLLGAPRPRVGTRINDLRRWKRFGGELDRPGPPAPMSGG